MALIICPDCGKEISDQAPACPNCGRPRVTTQSGTSTPVGKKIMMPRFATEICESCGSCAGTKTITEGSLGIEIILWLLMILPGVLYTVWRLTTRRKGCRICGGKVYDIHSARGRELADRYYQQP